MAPLVKGAGARLAFLLLSIVSASIFTLPSALFSGELRIEGYRAVFRPFMGAGGEAYIAIREFTAGNELKALAVNTSTFETSVIDSTAVEAGLPSGAGGGLLKETPYMRALDRYTSAPLRLQNHGIVSSERKGPGGVFLTVDLCPSSKAMDKPLFEELLKISSAADKPAEVNIAVSGPWIKRHGGELKWLLNAARTNRLFITWINHGNTHPYRAGAPIESNFLLTPGVDFSKEVLDNEVLMIEGGITPSPFFRFPGLVADGRLLEGLKGLSLIPIGSNAWLAKGEAFQDGSIILVHANGNEPAGIEAAIKFLRESKSGVDGKAPLRLLPLKDAFENQVKR